MTADVVVAGGGLAGTTLARFLAEAGHCTVLVERSGIGAGASGRNGGFVFRQPSDWINEYLDESASIYEELHAGPIPFDFRPRPMLMLAVEEEEVPRARKYAQAVGGVEHDTRADPWLADDLAAGYLVEGGYTLDPMGATSAMAHAARSAGAELRLGCTAKQVLVSGGRVTGLDTDAGPIATERVVVATGPHARFLLRSVGIDVPVAATRGWLLETGPVAQAPPYAIEQAAWPLQSEIGPLTIDRTLGEVAAGAADQPGLVSLLLGPRPAGQLVIGTSLRVSLREEPEGAETVRLLAERAVRIAPHLAGVTVAAAWSGRRGMTRDGLPVVGAVPGIEGLEIASGFSSIGMVTIPAACRRFVRGDVDALFDPARFL